MNIENIAKKLCQQSLMASHSEMIVTKLEDNNHYKVCYRFLANMLSEWRELGFEHFPTENEAIIVAKKSHPYFLWSFKNLDKLEEFKIIYDFHKNVWECI